MQKEHLPSPVQLPLNRLSNEIFVIIGHNRLHRQTIHRWSFNSAHVARASQRQIQRAGNRGCRQGEHIHVCAQHLEPFLVCHPKTLLLVDHDQTQILKLYVRLNEAMCSNHNVHCPTSKRSHRFRLLTLGTETRQQIHPHRIFGHAFGKSVEVLLGKNRRRHQHGHLFACHDRLECSANCHLGFTEPNVPANQPVHGLFPFHVTLGIIDGLNLILRFLINKRGFELALPCRILIKGMPAFSFTHCLDTKKFRSQITYCLLGFFLCFFPALSSKHIQGRIHLARTHVFTNQMGFTHRHI